ncbi:MAG: hypothetical protein ACYSWP_05595 [Planctomycetota bacterium]
MLSRKGAETQRNKKDGRKDLLYIFTTKCLARPKGRNQSKKEKGKTSESRQAGITLYYRNSYVSLVEKSSIKNKELKDCSTERVKPRIDTDLHGNKYDFFAATP